MGNREGADSTGANIHINRIRGLASELLDQTRKTHELYYLINLFSLWGIETPVAQREEMYTLDFATTTNKYADTLFIKMPKAGEKATPHAAMFGILLLVESKMFYAELRNLVHIARGEDPTPEPWRKADWGGKNLSTKNIIRNVQEDLEKGGFRKLASEFADAYSDRALIVRHSVAHGTFLPASEESGDMWRFGDYRKLDGGSARLESHAMSPKDLRQLLDRILFFRYGVIRALRSHQSEYHEKRIMFDPPDTAGDTGIIAAQFLGGHLSVVYKMGAPAVTWQAFRGNWKSR